jgi:hypothetical protein
MLYAFRLWYRKDNGQTGLAYVFAGSATEAEYKIMLGGDVQECKAICICECNIKEDAFTSF